MQLYLTTAEDKDHKPVVKWSGTQTEARNQRKEMKNLGLSFIETEAVDVPTNKTGLLTWLNANAV